MPVERSAERIAIRSWCASTHHGSGDYTTIVLIEDGEPTEELRAIQAALAIAAEPAALRAARRYAHEHPESVDTFSDADPGL